MNWKEVRKGKTFTKQYLFGRKIHLVRYTILKVNKKEEFVLATDGMGDVYRFDKNELE